MGIPKNACLFALQGSYGVVKLAYNEDSEQYYVSRDACIGIHVAYHHCAPSSP